MPIKFDRWIRSKLSQTTALMPSNRVPLAAQSRELPVPYSLPPMTTSDVLLECQERGVRVHNAGVFASGLLVGGSHYKYGPPPDEVKQRTERWKLLAEEHGVPLPAVAIAFATTPAVVDACAVGVKSPEEVAQTIAWLHLTAEIPTALWSDARARGLLDPRAPVPSDA